MTERNLKELFSHLGKHARGALESAAGMVLALAQHDVCVSHWLVKLLEQEDNDLRRILSEYQADVDGLQKTLQREIDEYPTGNVRTPALHGEVIDLTELALEVASQSDSAVIRSGHLCCILSNHASFAAWRSRFRDVVPFDSIQEDLTTRLHSLVDGSPEDKDVEGLVEKRNARVFISYSRNDFEFTKGLALKLRENGVEIWMDRLSVGVGEDWDAMIDRAIETCPIFLIVLSPSSVESLEVRAELRAAVTKERQVVPVMMRDCKLPRYLAMVNYVDFSDTWSTDTDRFGELLEKLRDIKNSLNAS